jgi:hypothetical protein
MKRLYPLSALVLLGSLLCSGCNSGHDSCCSSNSKEIARQRAVATMRITRATLAVVGFARRITTREVGARKVNRIGLWLNAIRRHRTASASDPVLPVLDADTNLYYTITVNPDGSGQQSLFVDSGLQQTAGAFTWTAPKWTNDRLDTYPATFQSVYQITAGAFAGEHGTIAITSNDVSGENGMIAIDLTNAQKEHCKADFTLTNGVLKAKAHCTFPDHSSCDQDYSLLNDILTCTTTYFDGGTDETTVNPDGSATQTVNGPDGVSDAVGTVEPNGDDTIEYDDGTYETINVDTNTDVPDDSGDSDSDRSAKRAKIRAKLPAFRKGK